MDMIARLGGAVPAAVALTITVVAPVALALSHAPPRPGEPVVVIGAPWTQASALVFAAGGRLVAPGRVASIALAWSDNAAFTSDLYRSGAWFVLDANLANALCQPVMQGGKGEG